VWYTGLAGARIHLLADVGMEPCCQLTLQKPHQALQLRLLASRRVVVTACGVPSPCRALGSAFDARADTRSIHCVPVRCSAAVQPSIVAPSRIIQCIGWWRLSSPAARFYGRERGGGVRGSSCGGAGPASPSRRSGVVGDAGDDMSGSTSWVRLSVAAPAAAACDTITTARQKRFEMRVVQATEATTHALHTAWLRTGVNRGMREGGGRLGLLWLSLCGEPSSFTCTPDIASSATQLSPKQSPPPTTSLDRMRIHSCTPFSSWPRLCVTWLLGEVGLSWGNPALPSVAGGSWLHRHGSGIVVTSGPLARAEPSPTEAHLTHTPRYNNVPVTMRPKRARAKRERAREPRRQWESWTADVCQGALRFVKVDSRAVEEAA
jgi:hypothetical protein